MNLRGTNRSTGLLPVGRFLNARRPVSECLGAGSFFSMCERAAPAGWKVSDQGPLGRR